MGLEKEEVRESPVGCDCNYLFFSASLDQATSVLTHEASNSGDGKSCKLSNFRRNISYFSSAEVGLWPRKLEMAVFGPSDGLERF